MVGARERPDGEVAAGLLLDVWPVWTALLVAVVVAMFTFGRASGMDRSAIAASLGDSLGPIAGIFLIVLGPVGLSFLGN